MDLKEMRDFLIEIDGRKPRTHTLSIRWRPQEWEEIRTAAEKGFMDPTSFVRVCCLSQARKILQSKD